MIEREIGKHLGLIALALGGALLTLAYCSPAEAQGRVCLPKDAMVQGLASRYQENLLAEGDLGERTAGFYLSSRGSWSLVVDLPSGMSCIIASGTNWRLAKPLEKPSDEPTVDKPVRRVIPNNEI